jgi:hypothetical protein
VADRRFLDSKFGSDLLGRTAFHFPHDKRSALGWGEHGESLADDRSIFSSGDNVCVVLVINPGGLEFRGGFVEDYEIWAATFNAEDVDAEVFDRAVHIAKGVISGFELRGGEHDFDQGVLDYFFSASAVFQDA